MRPAFLLFTAAAVMALAFWAYSENYRTQAALGRIDRVQAEIGAQRRALTMLRAEWAYLNRPARLRSLAAMNFDRLELLPLAPEQFARVGNIAYPLPPEPELLTDPDLPPAFGPDGPPTEEAPL